MVRRGITLIDDETQCRVNVKANRSGEVSLNKNSVVTVIDTSGDHVAGGAVHVDLDASTDNMEQLSTRSTVLCSSLELTLPEGTTYMWLVTLLLSCYPFMHTLTINRLPISPTSPVVNSPLHAHSLERLLRFDNFPSLRRIIVRSACCVCGEG